MTSLTNSVKPGDIVATTNIKGYEGMEVAVYLGVDPVVGKRLLFLQWIGKKADPCKVFREDFDETFYKITLKGVDEDGRIIFKRKRTKK